MSFRDLSEEIAAEFAGFGGGREFFGDGYGRDVRRSKLQKKIDRGAAAGEIANLRASRYYRIHVVPVREAAAKVAETWLCEAGCGTELRDDPHQRGPRKRWCSGRCYQRVYMRNRRASK